MGCAAPIQSQKIDLFYYHVLLQRTANSKPGHLARITAWPVQRFVANETGFQRISVACHAQNFIGCPMLILPALIVAIGCGTVGAALALVFGYGWVAALIAYWLAGNAGMLAVLLPRLFAPSDRGGSGPSLRESGGSALSCLAITLGLAMVFWQTFHVHHLIETDTAHSHQFGAMIGLGRAHAEEMVYAVSRQLPDLVGTMVDQVLRLELWIMGLLLYFLGLLQAAVIAVHRYGPGRESARRFKAY